MPSFDVVSEVEVYELKNAVDQANKEVTTRFDFKGTNAKYELTDFTITMEAPTEFQLEQMLDIARTKLNRRGIDVLCLKVNDPEPSGKIVRQTITIRQGLDADLARRIVKMIKQSKTKVQAAIQGEKVRVTGKKRDDLQNIIALLREAELDMPLQYDNFRD
ncbi:MAG: YajQ family cyclic di-GMP-binding protein [Gammaproteobacteria bacterium]|nr:YajQ family cyclic di-GMP-binding protein [Gammaproteobacteria bacterium]